MDVVLGVLMDIFIYLNSRAECKESFAESPQAIQICASWSNPGSDNMNNSSFIYSGPPGSGGLERERVGSNGQAGEGVLAMFIVHGLGLDSVDSIGGDRKDPGDSLAQRLSHRARDAAVDGCPRAGGKYQRQNSSKFGIG